MATQTLEQRIDFSIQDVKSAINYILVNNPKKFINQDINDVFNSFSFGTIGCMYNIILNEQDGGTNIKITCSDRSNANTSNSASVTRYITEFTNILTARLQGAEGEEMKKIIAANDTSTANGKNSAFMSLIYLILFLFTAYYLMKAFQWF